MSEDVASGDIEEVELTSLQNTLEDTVYGCNQVPLLVDPTGLAGTYLKYRSSHVLMSSGGIPIDQGPDLRRHFLKCLQSGHILFLDYDTSAVSLNFIEEQQSLVPRYLDRTSLFMEKSLNDYITEHDLKDGMFVPNDAFFIVMATRNEDLSGLSDEQRNHIRVLRITNLEERDSSKPKPKALNAEQRRAR